MSGAKSILTVDVNSDQFKEFWALYQKYEAALGKQATKWDAVNAYIAEIAKSEAETTDELKAQTEEVKAQNAERAKGDRVEVEREKRRRDGDKVEVRQASEKAKQARQTADATKRIAENVGRTAASMVKWVALGGAASVLTGALGLWGLDRFAGGIGDARRSALGLGTTTGRAQAFNTNFGRVVGPDFLGRVADAQSSLSQRWAFNVLGIGNPSAQDPAELASETMLRARSAFIRGGRTQEYAEATGLTQFFSIEELRRLANTSEEEIRKLGASYREDAKTMEVRQEVSRKWQDLSTQLERGKWAIKGALVDGLVPLAPQFERISAKLTEFIREGLASDKFKRWIDQAEGGLEKFADYIGSDNFHDDLGRFATKAGEVADNLVLVAEGLVKALRWLHLIPDAERDNRDVGNIAAAGGAQASSPERRAEAMRFFMGRGWSQAQAAGIVANLEAESGLRENAQGDFNRKTGRYDAFGIAQWHPDRQAALRAFSRANGMDWRTREAQLAFVDHEIRSRPEGAMLARAGTGMDAGRIVSLNYERPANGAVQAGVRGRMAEIIAGGRYEQRAVKPTNDNAPVEPATLAELRRLRASGVTNLSGLILGLEGGKKTRAEIGDEIRRVSASTGIDANASTTTDASLKRIADALDRQGRGSVPAGAMNIKVENATGGSAVVSTAQVAK